MNRLGQWILLFGCASASMCLGACAEEKPSENTYEVPEHIRERETLRQDPYAEPRPDNAPIDPQFKGFFTIQYPDSPADAKKGDQQK